MRLKLRFSASASERTINVLPVPGTPSMRTWPPAKKAVRIVSMTRSWPMTTFAISRRTAATGANRRVDRELEGVAAVRIDVRRRPEEVGIGLVASAGCGLAAARARCGRRFVVAHAARRRLGLVGIAGVTIRRRVAAGLA